MTKNGFKMCAVIIVSSLLFTTSCTVLRKAERTSTVSAAKRVIDATELQTRTNITGWAQN